MAGRLAFSMTAALLIAGPRPVESAGLDPRYLELLQLYARGERAAAIAAVGGWTEGALQKQVGIVAQARLDAQRCPTCKNPLEGVPLRAAVLLHTDRDKAERPTPGREQLPQCPGMHARIAERFATVLARDPETQDFARRFFLAMAQRWQLDACFEDAHREARAGIELFPRDAGLLVGAGSVLEEGATLATTNATSDAASAKGDWLTQARRDFGEAVSLEPDLAVARLRLGRVLWRLGQLEPAREALQEAVARSREQGDHYVAYLAHLFLGRVHEDAARLEQALGEYRLAVELDPEAQSAAIALSHALQLTGEMEEARQVLARGQAGRHSTRDAYWDYLVIDAWRSDDLLAALHRESLE